MWWGQGDCSASFARRRALEGQSDEGRQSARGIKAVRVLGLLKADRVLGLVKIVRVLGVTKVD